MKVSSLRLGQSLGIAYFYEQYRVSDRDLMDKVVFLGQTATLLGAERLFFTGVGMAAQTPYFWAAAGPIIIGGGVSYWIDPDEGLENYEEFIFDMDLNEKVDATIWAADTLLEEGYDRSIGVVAPTAMNILSNRSAQTLEFAATRSPMAAMRFLIANQR